MLLEMDLESSEPLYQQLMIQIKKGILRQELAPGETLPSVRTLAGDIGINMHTVNKAYKLLVEEGVLQQLPKGFAVTDCLPVPIRPQNKQHLQQLVEEIVVDALLYSYEPADIEGWIEQALETLNRNIKELE